MAKPSNYPPLTNNPVIVVGPQFCSRNPIDLTIMKKVLSLGEGKFIVTAVNDDLLVKMFSAHGRWEVFRGDSPDSKNLLFNAKTTSLFQFMTKLDVFLAANTMEGVSDFKVKGSWSERSCKIYVGDFCVQMHKKLSVQSELFGKDNYIVTVHPNVDYAFIVALIIVLNAIIGTTARNA
ncbi:protein LURP-one-related 15-like [Macadamia integrifolia]|uniref:protein LURP-one-related 15-like n=1 Tax=Macadamia integrifolia TaxID=60698 RepID=UPI001C4FF2BA|nr:protein LURP-one-related 15-like [Macadamia integrifolia]